MCDCVCVRGSRCVFVCMCMWEGHVQQCMYEARMCVGAKCVGLRGEVAG